MTKEQFRRGTKLVLFGTLAATLICLGINLLTFRGPYFYIHWTLVLSTTVVTFFSLAVGWRQYCKKSESKKRGRNFGITCGFLLVILISLVFNAVSYLDALHECREGAFWSSICDEPFYYPLISFPFVTLIIFCFGGFLAPIIGGFVGHRIAK